MPAAVGPYSPWRRAGEFIILSGQLGLVPGETPPTLAAGGAAAELAQGLENAKVLLDEAGASFADVVKATLYLIDMSDFAAVNEVWVGAFEPPRPTRSTVAVAQLPLGARAEVELWAHTRVAP